MTKYTEKRENINKAIEAIEEGVKALFEDNKYKRYLKNMAMFHEYSYGNVVLIAYQCPSATRVAGYNTWQALNRHVKKGEKAIRIIAPVIYKKKEEEDDENNTMVYYKTVSVFDISQTEGAELKNPCMRELVDSCKDFKSLFEILKGITPCSVGFEEMANANGYFNSREKVIRIKEGMSESQTRIVIASTAKEG
ncbi:MAG: ArdC family protein, partial [bacterium]|nr:ArdC family protein [bacterium]